MRLSFSTVCALLAVSVVRGAPALDTATLLDNAKKAQVLNAEFLGLKTTDPCQGQHFFPLRSGQCLMSLTIR